MFLPHDPQAAESMRHFGERLFVRANRHDWQGGTIQFLAEGFFGWSIAGRIVVLPSGSS